jgi:hypothetical protein
LQLAVQEHLVVLLGDLTVLQGISQGHFYLVLLSKLPLVILHARCLAHSRRTLLKQFALLLVSLLLCGLSSRLLGSIKFTHRMTKLKLWISFLTILLTPRLFNHVLHVFELSLDIMFLVRVVLNLHLEILLSVDVVLARISFLSIHEVQVVKFLLDVAQLFYEFLVLSL